MSPRFCLSTSAFRSDTEPMLCDLLTLVEAPSAYRIKDGFLFFFSFSHELCESRGGHPGLPSLINLRFLWT